MLNLQNKVYNLQYISLVQEVVPSHPLLLTTFQAFEKMISVEPFVNQSNVQNISVKIMYLKLGTFLLSKLKKLFLVENSKLYVINSDG